MKVKKKDIKIFLLSFLGFVVLCFVIYISQQNRFENLINEKGKYTIATGIEIEKRRTGWDFIYIYKVNDKRYEGSVTFGYGVSNDLKVGKDYFVVFDPNKPKDRILIRYPSVPAEINLDSIPAEGWAELPVPVPKDSIRNFLY